MAISSSAIRAGRAFVEIFADDTKAQAVLKRFQGRMESFATSINQLGRSLLLPGLAAGLGLKAAFQTFGDFEQTMAKVKARLDATDTGFENLKEQAIDLGKSTQFSANEAAAAMVKFAEAGFDSQKIMAAMKATSDLAASGLISMEDAAAVVVSTFNTFNLQAGQIGHAIDVIAKAATESASDVQELAQAFVYSSAVASAAGIPLQDLVGVLSLLHDAGIKADIAGTTVRGAILALTDPSKEAAETMQRLGIQVKDARGNMLPFPNIIGQFQRALAGLGTAERLSVIGKIFDARQAAGFVKLVDFGAGRLNQRIRTIYNSQGAAAEIARIQNDTLKGDIKRLTGALQSLGITITSAVIAPLRSIVQGMRIAVIFADEWAKKNPEIAASIVKVGVALAIAGPALIGLSLAMKLTAFAVQPLIAGLKLARFGFGFLASSAMLAWRILNASVLPLLMAALRTVGAVLLSIGHLFVAAFTKGIPALIASTGWATLLGLALLALGGYMLYSSGIIETAIDRAKTLFGQLKEDAVGAWQAIVDAIAAGDVALAMQIPGLWFQLAWARAMGYVRGLWEDAKFFLMTVFVEATSNLSSAFLTAFYSLQAGWVLTTTFMQSTFVSMTAGLRKTWQGLSNWMAGVMLRVMAKFDPSINLDDAMKELEAINQAELAGINRSSQEKQRSIEEDRRQRLQTIQEEAQGSLDENERMRRERNKANEDKRAEAEKSIQDEIDGAKKALEEKRAEAARKRKEAEAKKEGDRLGLGSGGPSVPGLGDLAGAGASVVGTFNAAAARGFGAQKDWGREIATNTAATVAAVKKIKPGTFGP